MRASVVPLAALALTTVLTWSSPASPADPTPEIVRFPSLDADRTLIGGTLFRPPGGDGPWPAIVMMHGCSGLYRRNGDIQINLAAWIDRFLQWGYLVLAVDGFTPRGFRSICGRRERPLDALDDRPFDAYGGLAWLETQPFVQVGRVALVGWSNGAMATLSGLRTDRAKKFGGPLRFTAAAAFYPGCMTLKRQTGGAYRPYAPLLVMLGLADDWTLPEPCLTLMDEARAAGAPIEIASYEGAYHAFDHPNLPLRTRTARDARWKTEERTVTIGSDPAARAAAISRLRAWLARHLGGR